MLIKILKSYGMWEEDCTGWYDLYSVDDIQIYPVNDYDETPIPSSIFEKFEETLNGSKCNYSDIVLSLYYDLLITSTDGCTYDEFYNENIYNIEFIERRLKDKFDITLEIV